MNSTLWEHTYLLDLNRKSALFGLSSNKVIEQARFKYIWQLRLNPEQQDE
jgi:hypothetical protein